MKLVKCNDVPVMFNFWTYVEILSLTWQVLKHEHPLHLFCSTCCWSHLRLWTKIPDIQIVLTTQIYTYTYTYTYTHIHIHIHIHIRTYITLHYITFTRKRHVWHSHSCSALRLIHAMDAYCARVHCCRHADFPNLNLAPCHTLHHIWLSSRSIMTDDIHCIPFRPFSTKL